ncbi:MAG TPA: molybdopterin-dependent oxidoreductase [Acidimicrobiia bacterium]|nr:molybdopterin-dependent oxidoreductase [Acidimicrobiia bacterium]
MTEHVTFCRVCEPLCGLIATVEDGKLTGLRGDPDNPHSKGFVCTKGVAMAEVHNDPDRVLRPLRRVGGPGEFAEVSWDEAMEDIVRRLKALHDTYGGRSIAMHFGNPMFFSFSAAFWAKGLMAALGSPWFFSMNSEDASARIAASAILYGSPARHPIPDVPRTDFLLIIGANPWVSHGSMWHDPRHREHIEGVVTRGGRVVVVDPRRTETARRFEHIPIAAGTDAVFLLSILHVLFAEDLVERAFLDRWATGAETLASFAARRPPEATEAITGIPAATVRDVARSFARAEGAVVYGRTGTCTQKFGTLTNVLQDAVNVVTGNLDRPGGWIFGWDPIDSATMAERLGLASYGKVHTRVNGLPDSYGLLPATQLAPDITTPGEGRIRSLITVGCNPVLAAPNGERLAEALESLHLHVSLDLYVNETNRHAHYILPGTTMFEREDVPVVFLDRLMKPFLQATEAVVAPAGEARPEWTVFDEIARRMGLGGAYQLPIQRRLAKLGIRPSPRFFADVLIRASKVGDLFGLRRSGTSFNKLVRREPHGRLIRESHPTGVLGRKLKTPDHRVQLADPRIVGELQRLEAESFDLDPDYPLRLIGMRETRSHNSWMHNAPKLMPEGRQHALHMHPGDAGALGLTDGATVTVTSRSGKVEVGLAVSDEMRPGTVALPHGWGHHGGWRRANAAGGCNSNLLASADLEDLERLAAMSVLNAIPVRVEPVG